MPGDLGFQEILVIHDSTGAGGPELAAAQTDPAVTRAPVLLRFGNRVEIRGGSRETSAARIPDVSAALLESLTETERFGVEALQLRSNPDYKRVRPRDGERWDMPGCAGAPPPEAAMAGE
jgi:hypothetical protein